MMAEVIEYNLSNDIKVKFDNGEIVKTRWERFSTGSVAVPSCYARNHIGDKKIQNRGNEEAEIIEVKDANHITVKFKDGTIVKDRKYEDFIHGAIGKPGIPQLRRTLKNERLWTEKIMRNGMKAKIVRYGSANDIDIKFSNGTIVMHKTYANFCSGNLRTKVHSSLLTHIRFHCFIFSSALPDSSEHICELFSSLFTCHTSRAEITKKVNQSKYEKYYYITNRLRREQFPLDLFKYSSKIENYICSILCIRYIF